MNAVRILLPFWMWLLSDAAVDGNIEALRVCRHGGYDHGVI